MADKFTVELDLDDTKSNKKIKGLAKTAKTQGSKIGRNLAAGIRRGSLRALNALRSRILGLGVALIAVLGSRAALRAAARQEDAINSLNQALASAGQFTKETSKELQEFATNLQQISIISDEVTLEMLALAQSFVKTAEEAKELTRVALDFSVGAGISFEESIRRLGRGVQGASGDIANFAPQIRGLTRDQLAAGEATRILGERFAGAAAAQLRTFSGITTATTNALGDMLENLGFIVTRSPVVIEAIKKIKTSIEGLSTSIAKFNKDNGFERIAIQMIAFGRTIVKFVVIPLELIIRIVDVLVKTIIVAMGGILDFIGQVTLFVIRSMNLIQGRGFQVTQDIQSFFGNITKASIDAFKNLEKATAALFKDGVGVSAKLDAELAAIKLFIENANNELGKLGKGTAPEDINTNLDAIKNKIKSFASVTVNVTSTLIQGLTTQLLQGGKAFQSFGKTALNLLGDFAIQLGVMIIASSEGILALQASLSGFGAAGLGIAAGIALIAVGAALKSFAGGPAGLASAGTVAVTPVPPAGDTTGQIPDIEQKPPVEITVVVEGNILDRRETGLEIVEVIRETLLSNDVGSDLNLAIS